MPKLKPLEQHTPYYEEARLCLVAARRDGFFARRRPTTVFEPSTRLEIIEGYE